MKQGTEGWLQIRKGRISASKIPIIMGLSPNQTPRQLWEEELGLPGPKKYDKHMKEGLRIEDKALEYFHKQTGIKVYPQVVFHPENNKFMASLDGVSRDMSTLVEIKNNNVSYHTMAKKGQIVEFHQCQMQWQMYVLGLPSANYLSYRENYCLKTNITTIDAVIVTLCRNDAYIEQQIKYAVDFLRMLDEMEEPPLIDSDYQDLSGNSEINDEALRYKKSKELAKYYDEQARSSRDTIISLVNDRNAKGVGWKITKSRPKARLDYEAIMSHHNIDAENCRLFKRPATTSYRITVE